MAASIAVRHGPTFEGLSGLPKSFSGFMSIAPGRKQTPEIEESLNRSIHLNSFSNVPQLERFDWFLNHFPAMRKINHLFIET